MSRFRFASLACSALLLVMLASSGAWAQFSSGLEGTVFDPTGAVVPNANVTIKQVSTGVEHTTVTSSAGSYRFTSLPPSVFTVTVKAPGFETAALSEISIQVAETRTLNVTLKLGAATQSIEVTASALLVSTVSGLSPAKSTKQKYTNFPWWGETCSASLC